jgi:hypothetical protein
VNGTKNLLASKTFWGAVVSILGAIAPTVGPAIGVQPGEWGQIMTGIGAVVAIYGRIVAQKQIG